MVTDRLDAAKGLLAESVSALREPGTVADGNELIDALKMCRELQRLVDQVKVETVAALDRHGVFTEHGYNNPTSAVATVLTLEDGFAKRIVTAAEQLRPRTDLQGRPVPPRLPATAEAFAAGAAGLEHVAVLDRLMRGPAAARLAPQVWAGVEREIAAMADVYTPYDLRAFGSQLIEAYDQDGPEPDDRPKPLVNEVKLTPLPGGGGKIAGKFEDAAQYSVIASVLDAMSRPLTADDQRSHAQRQAEAMSEVFEFAATHADTDVVPSSKNTRPHVSLITELTDLQTRAHHAMCLDFGGALTPEALLRLCCDAAVCPIILDSAGKPLHVGRTQRTVPPHIRRAVAARDRGCAHPGCDRPPSWCDVHHIQHWAHGGNTDLDNLVMLCSRHHREIHSTDWTVRIAPDGLPEFYPPAFIDPARVPRRSPRARPPGRPAEDRPPGPAHPCAHTPAPDCPQTGAA
jgi:5-methylcytosine-specific restriction protein A